MTHARTHAELRQEVGEVRSATDKIAQQMRIKMKKMRKENDDFEKSHDNDPSLVKVGHHIRPRRVSCGVS